MAAHQAPPSLGFSRQEHWSGLPFPSPMHESEKWKWSCSVMSDSAISWTAAYQVPPSMGFSRQEYWSGLPLPSPSRPSRGQMWRALLASRFSMGLSEAVIGPALQFLPSAHFCLLPLLYRCWSPWNYLMSVLHIEFCALYAPWGIQSVIAFWNVWILHNCFNYHYISVNKKQWGRASGGPALTFYWHDLEIASLPLTHHRQDSLPHSPARADAGKYSL